MKKRTEELMRMLEKNENITEFIADNKDEFSRMTLCERLEWLNSKYGVKKADVINRSGLNQIYAYQIFAGTKKPSRDKLTALMFGYGLSVDDANVLLNCAGLSPLHPRDKRDAVLIFALYNKLSVGETDDLLFELNQETINKQGGQEHF